MKTILWKWILLLLVSSNLYAEPIYNQREVYDDFSKGLNTQTTPFKLPKNQGDIADNMRFDKKFGAVSKRDEVFLYGTPGGVSINGMHRYYLSDGSEYLIAALSTLLEYTSSGTFSTLTTGLTDSQRWQFVTYNDLLIGGNGYDNPIKWDGKTTTNSATDSSRSASALVAEVGAPFAERNTGSNLTASKWYSYRMGYSDGSVWYYPNTNSNTLQTGATICDITLTDIPRGDSDIEARYVYRTLACDTQAKAEATTVYYLATTIEDNTTQTWDDTKSDAYLRTASAPLWSTMSAGTRISPPVGNINCVHDERVFWAGSPDSPSYVWYAEPYKPNYYGSTNYERIRVDDGDSVTGLKEQYGTLTVFKDNSIQKYYTEGDTDNWSISDVYSHIGCRAPNSLANSPLGIFYLSNDGIYLFTGQVSQFVSDVVTPEVDNILEANLDNCAGVFNDNKYYLTYCDRTLGESINNRLLILDTIRNAYSKDTLKLNAFAVFGSGNDFGTLYSGSTDGKIYAHGREANILSHKDKTTFNLGTYNDVRVYGAENNPSMELGWDCMIDGWSAELLTKNANIDTIDDISTYLPSATIDRPDTDGQYTSPVLHLNANVLNLLKWNENLPSGTDVTFAVRTGSTSSVDSTWTSWTTTEYSNPSGSDLSSETADTYLQYRIKMTTGSTNDTPTISKTGTYTIQISYSSGGTATETSIPSRWRSGWTDLGYPGREKQLDTVQIYLTGSGGTLTFSYEDYEGNVDDSFDIDLSVHTDFYEYSFDTDKIGEMFRFEISDTETTPYDIEKIIFKFNVLEEQ